MRFVGDAQGRLVLFERSEVSLCGLGNVEIVGQRASNAIVALHRRCKLKNNEARSLIKSTGL
jgi:hypothetical protein